MTKTTKNLWIQYHLPMDGRRWFAHRIVPDGSMTLARRMVQMDQALAKRMRSVCKYRIAWVTITETHKEVK